MASLVAPSTTQHSTKTDNKPDQNSSATWPHSDHDLLTEQGLTYDVTYCGSVEVLRPMKDLDFQSRTVLARECIDRIYGALYPSIPIRKRSGSIFSTVQQMAQFVGTVPNLENGNIPVTVSVNIDRLLITERNSGDDIGCFQLSLVSFASKGDDEVSTCVAFVAKDADQGRACHVLMAPSVAIAKELIGTLGQAFDLKFSRLVAQRNKLLAHAGDCLQGPPQIQVQVPPPAQAQTNQEVQPTPSNNNINNGKDSNNVSPHAKQAPTKTTNNTNNNESSREYVNDSIGSAGSLVSPVPNSSLPVQSFETTSPIKVQQKQGVFGQPWFHGAIDREESESRLVNFGDFLVRESAHTPGQFVLSGRTEACGVKHLLLIDPDGNVRTRDRQFLSIAHLVQHHLSSATPIISQEIEIFLRHPVNVSLFTQK